ncbi:MAG: glycosyltransferase family 2 protein [Candidatus Moraniibacteriota bacterium]|jgi:glycosyltransferase involved in cell wall biosynthesis
MENSEKKVQLSVVVPVYNEEGNVAELHRKIVEACDGLNKSYEVIFVDDGSCDKTVEICKSLSNLTLIELRKNFGQTAAFDAGFKASVGDVIVTMDGDLQNDPADIGKLLEKKAEGYDIVSGWRFDRKDSFSKKFFSRTADKLRKLLLKDSIHDSGCSLKVYDGDALRGIDLFGEMHRFIPAILELDGYTVGEVKVSHHARVAGVTKYNWKRSVKGFVDMISIWFWRKYASRPLHFFGGGGMVFIFFGMTILAWMSVEKVFFDAALSERIWPLMGTFFIMLGVQFFVFGLLADIVMKNYYKGQKRMNYTVKNVVEL